MKEVTITTNKISSLSDHAWQIWPGWEIPFYLFVGGLTAGIMVIAALMVINGNEKKYRTAANRLIVWAPVFISLGMLALFIHLGHKISVWAFYITFQPSSPISWGAWILLLVYPVTIMMTLAALREGYPQLYKKAEKLLKSFKKDSWLRRFRSAIKFAEEKRMIFAWISVPVGIFLGVYTGVFLSTFSARPFWNSSILGPLFLVSGVSSAAAFTALISRDTDERGYFAKTDIFLIIAEISIFVIYFVGMFSSSQAHIDAVKIIFGGELTAYFWIFIFGVGLVAPAVLEFFELRGKHIPYYIAPSMVLLGGFFLRIIILQGELVARNNYIKNIMMMN